MTFEGRTCGGRPPVAPGCGSGRERASMDAMRYRGGGRMERGDIVAVAGEPGRRAYRIRGWDLERCLVMLEGPAGVEYAPPQCLVRI